MEAEEFLQNAAHRAPGSYVEVSAIDLCRRCTGNPVRGYTTIPQVRDLLTRYRLRTEPDFANCDGDTRVRLVPATDEPMPDPGTVESTDEFELPEVAPRVRDLPAARAGLESVRPGTPASVARDRLIRYGYQHLAILSSATVCLGMVTLGSIATASGHQRDPKVEDARVAVPTARLDDGLFDTVEAVLRTGCVFVLDERGRYCGEVTAEQVTEYLVGVVEPFYIIGEIERRIRRRLNECFAPEDFEWLDKKKKPQNANGLTFGKYHTLLNADDRFARTHWAYDRTDFVAKLHRVNVIRNSVMHFNSHRLPESDLQALREFCRLLRHLGA